MFRRTRTDREDELRTLTEQALQHLRFGDEPGAEALFQRCWAGQHPEWSARAGLELGQILFRRGQYREAVAILRQSIDTWGHPTYGTQAMVALAVALSAAGDLAGAERQYRQVARLGHPDLSQLARFSLGDLAHRQDRTGEAQEHYQAVLAAGHPEFGPRAGLQLGVLHSQAGRWEPARAAFAQVAASSHPQQSELARQHLLALPQVGPGPEPPPVPDPAPVPAAEPAPPAEPDRKPEPGPRPERDLDPAPEPAAPVRAEDRAAVDHALRQGQQLEAGGDLAAAERWYQRADQLGSGEGACSVGALRYEWGDLPAAEAALRRADSRHHPMGTFRLGFLLEATGRADQALAVYRRAAEHGSVLAMHNLGNLLQQRGDRAGARAAFARIITDGTDPELVLQARRRLASLEAGPARRPVPPPGFDPEASALDSLLWVAGDPADDRVQRAREFVLAHLEPALRHELTSLIRAIDQGTVRPDRISLSRYLQALLDA